MLNRNLLRSEIAKNGLTQKELAIKMGISEQTLTRRIKRGKFGTDEVSKIITILHLADPMPIFFAS